MGNEKKVVRSNSPAAAGWRRRKRWPGPVVWAIAGLFVALLLVVRTAPWLGDRAVNNILTLVFGFDFLLTIAVWFLFFSSYSGRTRRRVIGSVCALLVLTVVLLRSDHTSGDIVPKFRFFWTAAEAAPPPPKSEQEANLATTTSLDFPQFLGPDRNLHYTRVRLAPSWSAVRPRLIWRHSIGAAWSAFSAVNGYAVTMEQDGDRELVTCYEIQTGNQVWSHGVDALHDTYFGGMGPRSTPTIVDGKVVALGATGVLRCLDGAAGKEQWRVDLQREFGVKPGQESKQVAWGRASSPLVIDGRVIVPAGGPPGGPFKSLAAFDLETGQIVWTAGDDQIGYSSPVVATLAGVRQILSVNEATVSGHQAEDGSLLWSLPWEGSSSGSANTSQPMTIDGQSLLVSKGYSKGAARIELSAAEDGLRAEFAWKVPRVLRTKLTSAVIQGDFAYGLNDGVLECVDVRDGSRMWKLKRLYHGQLLCVHDLLVAISEDGDLYLIKASPTKQPELGLVEGALAGVCWNNLCLYGRLLLIRSDREAACYELPVQE